MSTIPSTQPFRLGSHTPSREPEIWWSQIVVITTLVLASAVRAFHVLRYDFPLNDGGLFFVMAQDVQQASYHLPRFTSYNDFNIPFVYPPLAFYVAGLSNDLTGIGMIYIFRFVPLVVTCLTVLVFYFLARSLLGDNVAVLAATLAFALMPRSFVWLLMGGGITRAFGLLFALLALHQIHRFYTSDRWWFSITTAFFAALAVLSHLEVGWFLAYSTVLFFLAYGRSWNGFLGSIAVALTTIALTAPWWALVLAEHGSGPLLAGSRSGGSPLDPNLRLWAAFSLARFGSTAEQLFPVIQMLGLLGALACLLTRRWLLVAWWTAIVLLNLRAFTTYTTIPVALLAGIGFSDALLPSLRRLSVTKSGEASNGGPGYALPGHGHTWAAGFIAGGFVAYAAVAAFLTHPSIPGEISGLTGLSPDERSAMTWIASETPPSSQFIVLTGIDDWGWDKSSEWFPALTRRRSVVTPQGTEWLQGNVVERLSIAYEELQACANQHVSCLTQWSESTGIPFTHVYVHLPETRTRRLARQCCAIVTSLLADDRYVPVYEGSSALVFARREPPG